MNNLENKIALITGAASGVGLNTTKDYLKASNGSMKFILVDLNIKELERLKNEYLSLYPDMKDDDIYVTFGDLSSREKIDEFFEKIPAPLIDNLDFCVNSAGLARGLDRVGSIKQNDINLMFNTNILGLMTMCQLVVPIFKKNNKGTIVNIGSLAGEDPYPGGAAYCSSKAAVKAFNTALRKELVNFDIRVILIEPGLVNTNFSLTRFDGDTTKADSVYKDYEPLAPTDVSDLIVYVTSRRTNCAVSDIVILPTRQATMSDKAYR
ncbi:CYFA0S06e04192g1_1 [Cyberlindnera fabianii]|uniref:CYFA0S06e04192g1_1 n=1 Tax=Cyberlindnera fabianii TaxID=36022 RepID=A0A061AVK9_CYBFA|nr:NADP-dependent L-serine/L-allo-threonine dehydrogenase YdfG [Cyberlindnera fabianii]CDR41220.1 CYFA0S06e04192g1_1 [Cyberlindnera fabianii]